MRGVRGSREVGEAGGAASKENTKNSYHSQCPMPYSPITHFVWGARPQSVVRILRRSPNSSLKACS